MIKTPEAIRTLQHELLGKVGGPEEDLYVILPPEPTQPHCLISPVSRARTTIWCGFRFLAIHLELCLPLAMILYLSVPVTLEYDLYSFAQIC